MRRGAITPYLLIAPATAFLGVLFVVPLVQTVALAFRANGSFSFGNFASMAGDINFNDAIVNTFEVIVLAVPLQLALALGMAMMLRHMRHGRDIVLWIWSIPLGISDLAAGLVWLAILTDRGYLNTLLFHLGIIAGPQSWLTYETPATLLIAIVVAEAVARHRDRAGDPGRRRAACAEGIRRGGRGVRRHALAALHPRHAAAAAPVDPDRADPAHRAGVRDVRHRAGAGRPELPGADERDVQLRSISNRTTASPQPMRCW